MLLGVAAQPALLRDLNGAFLDGLSQPGISDPARASPPAPAATSGLGLVLRAIVTVECLEVGAPREQGWTEMKISVSHTSSSDAGQP